VRHAAALPEERALTVPGSAEGLARAVGVVPPLGVGALLADGGVLARPDADADALLGGVRDAEGQGVPLTLTLGDPEGLALRDGDGDARGEGEARGVPVCCAAVALCEGDSAAVCVVIKLGRGEGEGPSLPEAAPNDAVGPPLTLGERESKELAAADADAEGNRGDAVLELSVEGEAACDTEKGADADCSMDPAGVAVSPDSVANTVGVDSKEFAGETDAAAEGEAFAD
jgi:hypothetical protein